MGQIINDAMRHAFSHAVLFITCPGIDWWSLSDGAYTCRSRLLAANVSASVPHLSHDAVAQYYLLRRRVPQHRRAESYQLWHQVRREDADDNDPGHRATRVYVVFLPHRQLDSESLREVRISHTPLASTGCAVQQIRNKSKACAANLATTATMNLRLNYKSIEQIRSTYLNKYTVGINIVRHCLNRTIRTSALVWIQFRLQRWCVYELRALAATRADANSLCQLKAENYWLSADVLCCCAPVRSGYVGEH